MPLARRRDLICLVTDRRRLSRAPGGASPDQVVAQVRAAGRAGVDLIQIRERDLPARDLVALVRRCVAETAGKAVQILVNDRIDVAMAAGAAGVHLRADSIDAVAARTLVPPDGIVGRSVHTAAESGSAAARGGVDYLLLGTILPSASKTAGHALIPLDEVRQAAAGSAVPLLAIGGITLDGAEAVVRAGAAGVAAIGLFIPPPGGDVESHLAMCVARLRAVFDTCRAVT